MVAGSTVDAASMLYVSQPAVSNAIMQLENRLGFKLFARIKGRLHPTAEAKVLLAESEKVFTDFNRVHHLAQELRDGKAGALRIAASPSIGQTIMPSRIAMMRRDCPAVKFYFEIRCYDAIIRQIATQQLDLAVTLCPSDHPSIQSRTLATGDMVCVLNRDSPLCKKKAIRPAMLRDHPLVSFSRDTPMGLLVDNAFREVGEHREVAIQVDHCNTACVLVENNAGAAVVDEFTARSGRFSDLVVKPFHPRTQFSVSSLHHREMALPILAKIFLERYLDLAPAPTAEKPAAFS